MSIRHVHDDAALEAPVDVTPGSGGLLGYLGRLELVFFTHKAASQSWTLSAPSLTTTVPTMRSWMACRFASQYT